MTAEGRTALTLSIAPDGKSALLRKPRDTAVDDGLSVSGMKDGVDERPLEAVEISSSTSAFKPAGGPNEIRFKLQSLDSDHAQLTISTPNGATKPMALVRARTAPVLATDWENRPYTIDQRWPDNPEMKAIFAEDQADRSNPATIDWAVVTPRDEARRARTLTLLNEGKLRSSQDYYAAAFVFQHGDKAEDFLLAHSLALAAAARGNSAAAWIGAATLDRYLFKIGQPQIYGTQFLAKKGEPATQGNYNRALVPDSLRAALGVPSLAEQEEQRRQWEERMNPGKGKQGSP